MPLGLFYFARLLSGRYASFATCIIALLPRSHSHSPSSHTQKPLSLFAGRHDFPPFLFSRFLLSFILKAHYVCLLTTAQTREPLFSHPQMSSLKDRLCLFGFVVSFGFLSSFTSTLKMHHVYSQDQRCSCVFPLHAAAVCLSLLFATALSFLAVIVC